MENKLPQFLLHKEKEWECQILPSTPYLATSILDSQPFVFGCLCRAKKDILKIKSASCLGPFNSQNSKKN
jgi:hypothetical protein